MDGNKDEAVRCLEIGKQALEGGDRTRALKFVTKALRLYPSLSGADDLLSKIQDQGSGHQFDPLATGVTDGVSSSSRASGQSSVRRRVPESGSTPAYSQPASVTYTEEQISLVRQIRKKKDYYEILGVERTCSENDIRKAYRKLSLKVHPDKNTAPGAEEAFKGVSKAFQCLSNEESRRKYDVVGSDEPVYERRARRSQGFNGFYDGDIDADEIFRNFFGGMGPTTQFRGFQFGTNMGARTGGANHQSGEFNFRALIQLLPVLIILLFSFMPSSDPVYALYRSYPYEHKLMTPKGVPFYVKSENFDHDYPPNSSNRESIEHRIETDYFAVLRQNCRLEMQRRQWGYANEMTHCDMLKRFENVA